eukprot:TRINITY_DN326_c0_g1_i1.p1 TRINITY_DN326_c0_g1~~TRINITY_DN326_c0_g1_i1.p1  ORF type:complete len:220 (+),score=40.96 TRINITY_DN326_c0_g1_i1:48-707(+)
MAQIYAIFVLCVLATSALAEKRSWNLMREPKAVIPRGLAARQGCANEMFYCQPGYFCVDNALCLEGKIDEYSPLALLTAGVVAELASNNANVDCLGDITTTLEELINAFVQWENSEYTAAMTSLTESLQVIVSSMSDCDQSDSMWQTIFGYFKEVMEFFFPEVRYIEGIYEIMVEGVNIYDDFSNMMNYCSDDVADYINCGVSLGDMILQVYEAVDSRK